MACIHGKDSGQKWGLCKCKAIECHCAERIDSLRKKLLTDPVDYHTKLTRPDDPYSAGYVLVREKWCDPKTCSYYSEKPPK